MVENDVPQDRLRNALMEADIILGDLRDLIDNGKIQIMQLLSDTYGDSVASDPMLATHAESQREARLLELMNWQAREEMKKAVADLDAIDGGDAEGAHAEADEVLLRMVPRQVRQAYERLRERSARWACA